MPPESYELVGSLLSLCIISLLLLLEFDGRASLHELETPAGPPQVSQLQQESMLRLIALGALVAMLVCIAVCSCRCKIDAETKPEPLPLDETYLDDADGEYKYHHDTTFR